MIKILDAWWGDPKRNALVRRVKSCELADGVVIDLWREFKGVEMIPLESFHSNYMSELKGAGLIDLSKTSVWVIGRGILFDWVCSRAEAGKKGGQVSAKRLRAPGGQLLPIHQANVKKHSLLGQAKPKQRPLLGDLSTKTEIATTDKAPTSQFIAFYVTTFQKRYPNVRPDLRGKVQGQIKTLLKDVPYSRACNLLEVYLQLDTPWFITKGHDFTTFMENINPISIALDTGQQSSGINWNKVFAKD